MNAVESQITVQFWWLVEVPCQFKAGFPLNILGIFRTQYAKDNFTGIS